MESCGRPISTVFIGTCVLEIFPSRRQVQEYGVASFDGDTVIPMVTGDRIVIEKAAVSTKILKLNHLSFVEVLRQKMRDS